MVGYSSICFCAGNVVAALLGGLLIGWIPRPCQLVAAFLTNIDVGVTWLLWQPTGSDAGWMLGISFIQGLTCGVGKTQLVGLFIC
jgi:hypothetical protein